MRSSTSQLPMSPGDIWLVGALIAVAAAMIFMAISSFVGMLSRGAA